MARKLYIHSDPEILLGKPVIRGTRLSVEFLLELLAAGWTEDQLLESYPQLTKDSIRAMYAFAAECVTTGSRRAVASDAVSR